MVSRLFLRGAQKVSKFALLHTNLYYLFTFAAEYRRFVQQQLLEAEMYKKIVVERRKMFNHRWRQNGQDIFHQDLTLLLLCFLRLS